MNLEIFRFDLPIFSHIVRNSFSAESLSQVVVVCKIPSPLAEGVMIYFMGLARDRSPATTPPPTKYIVILVPFYLNSAGPCKAVQYNLPTHTTLYRTASFHPMPYSAFTSQLQKHEAIRTCPAPPSSTYEDPHDM